MRTEAKMRELVRELAQKTKDQELMEAVVDVLETDENFETMIQELRRLKNPSRECILGKAILIAEPD